MSVQPVKRTTSLLSSVSSPSQPLSQHEWGVCGGGAVPLAPQVSLHPSCPQEDLGSCFRACLPLAVESLLFPSGFSDLPRSCLALQDKRASDTTQWHLPQEEFCHGTQNGSMVTAPHLPLMSSGPPGQGQRPDSSVSCRGRLPTSSSCKPLRQPQTPIPARFGATEEASREKLCVPLASLPST